MQETSSPNQGEVSTEAAPGRAQPPPPPIRPHSSCLTVSPVTWGKRHRRQGGGGGQPRCVESGEREEVPPLP